MKTRVLIAVAAVAVLASGCSTTGGGRPAPVEATRYHLSQPIPPGTVGIQADGAQVAGPEFSLYTGAVMREMERLGFTPAATGGSPDYLVAIGFTRTDRGQVRTRPPVTIGIGGGSFGGNVGVGGGVSTGIGGKTRTVYGMELSVQIRRRGDNTVVWEGKAITETLSGAPGAQPNDGAARLAAALFKEFPGQSGITTTVK